MKYILSIILLSLSLQSYGSDTTSVGGKYQLKGYLLFTPNHESSDLQLNRLGYVSYVSINHRISPTLAFNFRNKKGNRHEIELSGIGVQEVQTYQAFLADTFAITSYGGSLTSSRIQMRYEYMQVFMKKKRFQPCIGLGISPYYFRYKSLPTANYYNFFTEHSYGIQAYLTPRINYYFSKRIFLDVNVPIKMLDFKYSTRKEQIGLSPNPNKLNGTDTKVFEDALYIRFGLGLKL